MLGTRSMTLIAVASLSACTIPVMETVNSGGERAMQMLGMSAPAALKIYYEDDSETFLTGSMQRKLNAEMYFLVSGPEWGECEGLVSDRLNVVSLSCENGFAFTDELRTQGTERSDVTTFYGNANGQEYVGIFGWGDQANEAALGAAFMAYVNEV